MPAASRANNAPKSKVAWIVMSASSSNDLLCTPRHGILLLRNLLESGAFCIGQSKEEGRAAAHLGFSPNAPVVTMNDPLYSCQPNAGSRKISRGVQALEGPKQLTGI